MEDHLLEKTRVLNGSEISVETARSRLGWAEILPIVPILVFLILFLVLAILDIRTVFEPSWLLPTTNVLFLLIVPLAVVYIATQGYVQSGFITLLMLGAGTLAFGLGALLAGCVLSLGGPNANVTVYNFSVLSSAMFHVLGAVLAFIGLDPQRDTRRKRFYATLTYLVIAILLLLLTIATVKSLTPVFFVQGEGPTIWRQTVLATAIMLFVMSGVLFVGLYLMSSAKVLYWYSLALFLIATGLICVLFQKSVGSPIGWLGRGGQYLGGIYLLVAVVSAWKDLHTKGLTMQGGIADLFRHRLAILVEERTSQLRRANEHLSNEVTERKKVEEELRQSRERLSLALEGANIGIWDWDLTTGKAQWSERNLRMLGYEPNEFEPNLKNWKRLVHPDDWSGVSKGFNDHIQGKSPVFEGEYRMQDKSGGWHWVAARGKVVRFTADEKPVRMTGVAIDVTDRKRAEEALRTNEAQLSNAVMMAHLGPWEYDVLKDLFTFNDHFYKLFRTTAEQVGGYTMSSAEYARRFVHPDDMSVVGNEIRKSIEATDPDFSRQLEHRIVYADGEIGHISVRIFLAKDELGRTVRTYGVNQDITERKQMEQALTKREQEFRTLVENTTDFIVRYDRDLRRIYVNPAWEKASGLSAEEVINVHVADVPKDPNPINVEYVEKLRQVLETGTPQEIEFTWVNARGVTLFLDYVIVPEYDPHGKIVSLLAVGHDLTERKKAEKDLHRLNRELRAISTCNQTLLRAVDEQTLLNDVCRIICDEAGYRMAWVGYAENDDAKTIRPVAWAGFDSGYIADVKLTWSDDTERGQGPAGTAIRSGGIICVNDFTTDPRMAPWRESALQRGYRSGIALPLKDENTEVFGVLLIYHSEPGAMTPNEIQLMEELAGDLAFGINGLRARDERNLAEESLALKNKMNEIFLTFSGNEMYGEVLEVILEEMKGEYGVFAYIDEEGAAIAPSLTRDVWVKCLVPEKSIVFPRDTWSNSIWGKAITEKRSIYANEPFDVPEGHIPINRALDVPILYQGEVIGHFLVGNKETDYDDQDKEKLEGIALSISAILNARTQKDRQEQRRRRAEEALRTTAERLNEAQRIAHIGSWELELTNNVLTWSDEIYRMFEIDPEKFGASYEAFLDAIHPDDRESVNSAYTNSLKTRTPYAIDHRIRLSDGRIKYVQEQCETFYDNDKPIRSVGTVQDITERKKAEEGLRASEEQYRSLFENSPVSVWEEDFSAVKALLSDLQEEGVDDIETYFQQHPEVVKQCAELVQITNVNRASLEMYEAANKEELCEDLIKTFTPESHATFERELISLWNGHTEMVSDAVVQTLRGKPLEVIVYFSVCPGYEETVSKVLVSTIDITARKQAEQDLRKSEVFYRSLYENISDCIFILDVTPDGRFKFVSFNPAEEKAVGMTTEQVANRFTDDLVSKDVAEQVNNRYQMCVEKRQTIHYEEELDLPKGKMSFLTSLVPIEGPDGRIYRIIGVARDISEQKSLQRQLLQAQKMEAAGTLAGGIAHDFNNVLQVVLGYSELISADEDLPDRLKDDLGKVCLAGRNGADLVQRLLTFSRKAEAKPLDLDLNQRIRQTHKFLQRTIPKMIDIELILADDLARIHADPTQVDQVLMNLAVNARDAMPGGGKLVIETANVVIDEDYERSHLEAKPGRHVLLRVSDTGSGMDKETLDHIFEPFFTTKEAGKGTGLGLAMVYGIVKQHGGYITCYSEPGEGTTFKMYFPVIEMEIDQDVTATGIMPAFGTETILLVDDEEFVRDLGKRILERSGYTVLTATNGKKALNLYKREKGKISLVILDLIMPEMGGKQCLDELLKIDPKARVLIASGFAANGQTKEAIETGARGFVGKPYNMKEMLQSVREVLDSD